MRSAWQRRAALLLFFILVVTPIMSVIGLMTLVFAGIYIPFMTVLYGLEGYRDGLGDISDAIMEPFAHLIYQACNIWIAPWDR